MLNYRLVLALAALLGVAPLGACAPSTAGSASASAGAEMRDHVMVRVNNNLIPPTSLTVYAVPETGSRSLVGNVNPGGTATLHFNPAGAALRYRFMARTTAGAEIVSNPISVNPGETLVWDVQANILRATS